MKKINHLLIILICIFNLSCSKKTEEELVLDQLDSIKTELYLSLKILVSKDPYNKDVDKIKKDLGGITRRLDQLESGELSVLENSKLIIEALQTLYKVKGYGQKELKLGKESKLSILDIFPTKKLIAKPLELEHAITAISLFLLEFTNQSPIPTPQEAYLYEAWMGGLGPRFDNVVDPVFRNVQAYVFAKNDYCELAAKSLNLIDDKNLDLKGDEFTRFIQKSLGVMYVGGRTGSPDVMLFMAAVTMIKHLPWLSRVYSNVVVAKCFSDKNEPDRSYPYWITAIETMEAVGFAKGDLVLLKAYLAYQSDDNEELKKHLIKLSQSNSLDQRAQGELKLILDDYNPNKKEVFEKLFQKISLSRTITKLIYQRLKDSGAMKSFVNIKQVKQLRFYLKMIESKIPSKKILKNRIKKIFKECC